MEIAKRRRSCIGPFAILGLWGGGGCVRPRAVLLYINEAPPVSSLRKEAWIFLVSQALPIHYHLHKRLRQELQEDWRSPESSLRVDRLAYHAIRLAFRTLKRGCPSGFCFANFLLPFAKSTNPSLISLISSHDGENSLRRGRRRAAI